MEKNKSNRIGFHNLIQKTSLPSDFPKPHRKDLMETIFRRNVKTQIKQANRAAETVMALADFTALGQAGIDVSLGVDLRVRKAHSNAIAAAIDHGSSNALHYTIRPPIRLPKNYEARLRDLDEIGRDIKRRERRALQIEKNRQEAKLKLSFESKILDANGKLSDVNAKPVDPNPVIVKDEEEEPQESFSCSSASEKSEEEELPIPITAETSNAYSTVHRSDVSNSHYSKAGSVISISENPSNGNAPDNWQARNVAYMLQIWQQAEGIYLPELFPTAKKERKYVSNSSSLASGVRPSVSNLPSISNGKQNRKKAVYVSGEPEKHDLIEEEDKLGNSTDELIQTGTIRENKPEKKALEHASMISESTFELLKRMSREHADAAPNPLLEKAVVERTLTGYDAKSGQWESIKSLEFEMLDKSKERKIESPFKNMTPGTCGREIGTYISPDGDLLPYEKPKLDRACDLPFQIGLPEPELMSSAAPTDPMERQKSQYGMLEENQLNSKNIAQIISQRLKDVFGNAAIQIKPDSKDNNSKSPRFSLKKFNAALRERLNTYCEDDNKLIWNRFLDSELSTITSIPTQHSQDWNELLKSLVRCLHEEYHRNLQYEAVCKIIQIQGFPALLRWDLIAYKAVLDDMLNNGNPYQKQIASIENVRAGNIDRRVIDHIRLGLGDLDSEKQQAAIQILSSLDISYAEQVVSIMVEGARHSNWRARCDVIAVLKVWIPRLAPSPSPPTAPRDPDALDSDGDVLIKALFNTLGTTTNITENVNIASTNEIEVKTEPKTDHLYDQCVQLLLGLMADDWSSVVRTTAASALGSLKQGKPVFNWVIKSLESSDPVKRVDSLKCLSFLGVMIKDKLPEFLKCFKDPYSTIKIEACRVH